MPESRTAIPAVGKAPGSGCPRCSHVRSTSDISTEPPPRTTWAWSEQGIDPRCTLSPVFKPLAYCPAKLVDRYQRTGEQAETGTAFPRP